MALLWALTWLATVFQPCCEALAEVLPHVHYGLYAHAGHGQRPDQGAFQPHGHAHGQPQAADGEAGPLPFQGRSQSACLALETPGSGDPDHAVPAHEPSEEPGKSAPAVGPSPHAALAARIRHAPLSAFVYHATPPYLATLRLRI